MLNIVLFGPPGAGKGTQSEKLISKYKLVHLSTGDILRGEIAAGTDLGMEAKKLMDAGVLVPDEVVIGMIRSKLDQNKDAKGFIFDGFPRTAAQAEALDNLLKEKDTEISMMLALEVDDEELTKRLLLRGKDSGRADDADEKIIGNRIKEYNNKTAPLKEYYTKQDKFKSVKGTGTVDEIFDSLSAVIGEGESLGTKVVNLVKAVAERVMPHSEEKEKEQEKASSEKTAAKKAPAKKSPAKKEAKEKPSIVQRVVNAVKNAVSRTEKAPVKKEAKKVVKKTAKKVAKNAAPKKALKAAKKVVKKAVKKVAAKKTAPKKAAKKVVTAAKKVAPKKAIKKVVKKAVKAVKKVAPKKAIKKAVKKIVKKAAAKKTAPKKAVKKAVKAVKKVAAKAAPKKAIKAAKKVVKKVAKKIAPAKKAIKKAVKKAAKSAPKKVAKKKSTKRK